MELENIVLSEKRGNKNILRKIIQKLELKQKDDHVTFIVILKCSLPCKGPHLG